MMKRTVVTLLLAASVLALSACGSSGKKADSSTASSDSSASTQSAVESPAPTAMPTAAPAAPAGGTVLPAYRYTGTDPFREEACSVILADAAKNFEPSDVTIPVPCIFLVDGSDEEDIKVWGSFQVYNYELDGTTLAVVNGGNTPGLMHMIATPDGYACTSFEQLLTEDEEELNRITGGNDEIKALFSGYEDYADLLRLSLIKDYVDANGLSIDSVRNMNGEVIVLDSINFDGGQSGETEEAGGEVTPQVRFESDEGNALYMEYDESNEIYNVYLEFSGESFEGNAYYADGRMDIDGTDPNGDPIYMQAISNGDHLVLTVTESSWDVAPAGSQYVMKAYLEA